MPKCSTVGPYVDTRWVSMREEADHERRMSYLLGPYRESSLGDITR